MRYADWKNLYGGYRWYKGDGSARVILPLDYSWENIYKIVTQDCDLYFDTWEIPDDIEEFTDSFLALVPTAWFRYKTKIEMFLGTLDGTTIDPAMFEAGYTRTTDSSQQDTGTESKTTNVTNTVNSSENSTSSLNVGEQTNSTITASDSSQKSRALNYLQGVQGLVDVNVGNIGDLDNRYASNIADNVGTGIASGETDETLGSRKDNSSGNVTTNYSGNGNEAVQDNTSNDMAFHETVHETRINYYDNLAFLRDRLDRIDMLQSFHKEFEKLFYSCVAMCKRW